MQRLYKKEFHFSSLQLVVLVSERVNSYEKTKANSSTNIWPTDSSLEDDLHVSGAATAYAARRATSVTSF
jgi:hypothetical protein